MKKLKKNNKKVFILVLGLALIIAGTLGMVHDQNNRTLRRKLVASYNAQVIQKEKETQVETAEYPVSVKDQYDNFLTIDNLINETNLRRQQNGLTPLETDPGLNASAKAKCEDMIAKEYFAHDDPVSGTTPWVWIQKEDVPYTNAGENLLRDNGIVYGQYVHVEFLDMWMESPSHKAAILNPKYSYIGIGTCYADSPSPTTYAVQHFTGY